MSMHLLLVSAMGDFSPLLMMGLRSSMLAVIGDQTFHLLPSMRASIGFITCAHTNYKKHQAIEHYVKNVLPYRRLTIEGEYRDESRKLCS